MVKWFILENEIVSGPLSTDQLQGQIEEGFVGSASLIWGKGLEQWSTISLWRRNLSDISEKFSPETEKTWHYAIDNESFGPYERAELIKKLSIVNTQNSEILVWTKGMEEWISLYDFHDLVMDLGIEVRRHPRKPINGQVYYITENNEIPGELKSISEGGLGAQGIKSFKPGDEVLIDIDSPSLGNKKYRVKATVKYVTKDHYAGLQFEGVGAEAKSAIVQYVKANSEQVKAAA